jgi:hypothetical protein
MTKLNVNLTCSVSGGAEGASGGVVEMEKMIVRVLDNVNPSSGDDAEGSTSRSEGGSSKHVRRLKLPAGRMKRTASAPVPPLLSMLSRTGKWLQEHMIPPQPISGRVLSDPFCLDSGEPILQSPFKVRETYACDR